jgi:phenylacetic acid degradation operon negative regulatory protein
MLSDALTSLRAAPSRTWSVIITLYGDAVVPRGGSLWLGTVLEIFAALEIGGNVVRTAMSRLATEGWLARQRLGRHSFYSLTESGGATFAPATARIYHAAPAAWDGRFHIALGDATPPGFAPLAPGLRVGLAPAPGIGGLVATGDAESARALAARLWPNQALAARYREFIRVFAPVAPPAVPLDAMLLRLLLIHSYRRILLRDPLLPTALLPPDWPGTAARATCASLYHRLLPASEAWLDERGRTAEGPLPAAAPSLAARFGGTTYYENS